MIKCQFLLLSIISIFFPLKVASAEFNSTQLEAVTIRIDVLGDTKHGGSGVVFDRQGQFYNILTAYHVVEKKRSYEVLIINPANRQIISKHIIDSNRDIRQINNYDLAEIKIQSSANYPIAKIGDSNQLQKREDITILGYPLPSSAVGRRTYSPTVYEGKVANILTLDSIRKKDGATLKLGVFSDTGMSGGPVVNGEGELVGILTKGDKDPQTEEKNSSLAIPIHLYPQWQAIRIYSPSLEELLSKKRWIQANDKTWEMLVKEGDSNKDGVLDKNEVTHLSCETLRSLDDNWSRYSDQKYGFKEQWTSYTEFRGSIPSNESNLDAYLQFANKVGWYQYRHNQWLTINKLSNSVSAKNGFFPVWFIYNERWGKYPFGLPTQPLSLPRDPYKRLDSPGTRLAEMFRV
ncbi:MAG: trypsin-like peptidase domain-containing protein [Crocosphaera sp.]